MASFTDLIAQSIRRRREDFLAHILDKPNNDVEYLLASRIPDYWHLVQPENLVKDHQNASRVGAVDGSRAIRALNVGADWIVAQALLIGSDGLCEPVADTLVLRGEIERPAIDRCAALLMRSLELELALRFVERNASQQDNTENILLLDGSLYSDLPYLLYNLPIGGYEDLPLKVLEQYLTLFEMCRKNNVILIGISKRTRSAVLGRAILADNQESTFANSLHLKEPDTHDELSTGDVVNSNQQHRYLRPDMGELPTDGELLHRWTQGIGLTDPVLLGSTSFGPNSARMVAELTSLTSQPSNETFSTVQQRTRERLQPIQRQLLNAPAIGTFYIRLADKDDVLRVDALASTFGQDNLRLLDFDHKLVPYTTALPIVQHLLRDYGGFSVYNAALYVVDREVRLHAETVDQIYFTVLRDLLEYPVQYDRSTRRFMR